MLIPTHRNHVTTEFAIKRGSCISSSRIRGLNGLGTATTRLFIPLEPTQRNTTFAKWVSVSQNVTERSPSKTDALLGPLDAIDDFPNRSSLNCSTTSSKTCGMAPFYVPRSNPDGWDINARCLDEGTVTKMKVNPFDGKGSWDAEAQKIAHLSKE